MITVFLDGLAKDWKLTKVWREAPVESRVIRPTPGVRAQTDKAPKLSAATGPSP